MEAAPLAAPAAALTAQEPVTPSVTLTSGVTLTPTFTSPLPTPEPPVTPTLPLPEPSPTTTLRLGVLESTGVDRGWQLTYNAPNVGLFSGAATFDYPLEVPPGRNGLQPDLRLSYNSRRVDGLLGWIQEWPGSGWSIDTLDIVRTSVNVEASGAINVSNRSLLLMNGAAYELFPVNTALEGQPGRYYAKDAPQLYVEMYGYQPSGELRTAWRVRTPDGTTWNLGTTADASQYVSNYYNASNAIYRWRLAEAQDVHGNKLQVSYHEQRSCGRDAISLPSTIRYNNYSTSAWASEITFVRSTVYPPVDVRWDFCNLLVFGDPGALERVEVRHLGQLLRTYRLTTDKEPGEWSPTRDLRRLYAVQLWNGTLALPATTFAYTNLINKEACFECGDPHRESTYAYPRLSAITNGYGAQVEFLYERVGGANDTNAGYDYRVQEQRTQDSIHTNPARTLYTYGTSWEKDYKVLGYDDVTVEARDYDGTTLLTRSQHWFNNPKTNTPGAAPLRGREYRSEADTGAPLPLRTDTLWGVRTQFTSTVTFGVVEAVTTTDELGAVVAIGYTYDAYGNRVLTYDYGAGTRSDGDERTTRRFLFNLTTNGRWFIGLQWAENRYSGITTHNEAWLQTQTLHYFDGYTGSILDETAHQATITKGLVTITEQGKWSTGQTVHTRYLYNSQGQLAETWDPRNARSTVAYDSATSLYPLTRCSAVGTTVVQCASTQYYGVNGVAADNGLPGQVKQVLDPNGVVTARYTYDTWGRLQQVYRPQPTGGEFLALRYEYMDTAAPSYVDQITAPNDAALRVTQRTFYDGLGRAVQSRLFHVPLADTTFTTVVQATEYDALGRAVCQLLPVNGGQQTFSAGLVTGCRTNAYPRTVTTYDALGRVAEVTQPDGARTLMQYQGRRTAVLDANGHQRISLADAYGQLIEVREYTETITNSLVSWSAPISATTRYGYDVLGNLKTVTDAANNQTTMEYDALGRKTAMTDPDMGSWAYRYDANGNLIKQRDARHQAICFYYDSLNRLTGKTYHSNQASLDTLTCTGAYSVTYTYDQGGAAAHAIGRRTAMSNVSGSTIWQYDLRGRVIMESKTITNGGTFTTTYQYNDLDQVTLITYPDGENVAQTYNPQGLSKTLNGTHTYVNAALYNALGQPRTLTLGNDLTTAYTYAATNFRLQRLWVGNLLDLNYTYDAVGNVTTLTDVTGNETQTFTYDALDRLIEAGTGSSGGAGAYSETYAYDAIGNLMLKNGVVYTYTDGTNPPTQPHAVKQVGDGTFTAAYEYNLNGNMTVRPGPTSLDYNSENRLSSVTTVTGTTTYLYDGDGILVQRSTPEGTTCYVNAFYELWAPVAGAPQALALPAPQAEPIVVRPRPPVGPEDACLAQPTAPGCTEWQVLPISTGEPFSDTSPINLPGAVVAPQYLPEPAGLPTAAELRQAPDVPDQQVLTDGGGPDFNLVANPGFEQTAHGWTETASSSFPALSFYRSTWGTAAPHAGSYAEALSNHAYGYLQSTAVTVTPNTQYDLYAYVRGELETAASGGSWVIRAYFYTAAGASLGSTNTASGGPGTLTTTWQRQGGRFTTPANTATVRIALFNYLNSGWVAYDDVELLRVGQSGNLAPNPGFESTDGWSEVRFTAFPATSFLRTTWGTAAPHSGSYGYAISNHLHGSILSSAIAVTVGAQYDLYAYVRGQTDPDASAGIWSLRACFYDSQGQSLSCSVAAQDGPGTLTTAWVRKGARLTVPSGAATARLRFYHYMNVGWVAVDDVEFIRVGQSGNLAPDPGFELGTGWSAIPTAGFPGTSLWRGGWGTGTPRSGTYAFALSNHSYGTLQTDPIAVLPGATYTLSAWVRGKLNAQASGGGWTLKLLAYDRQGAFISSYTVASGGGGSLTTTWQQRSGTVTLPGNATTVRVELFDYMTDGWVAMDDVSLTGPTVTKYYYLGSQRVAMRQGGVLTYLHGDHLGSASLATNASGAKVSEQRYLPYGGTRSGSMPTDRQFTGQRAEASLGFYDYVARQFDPALGRFLQADSIIPDPANPQSLNRYSYTLGNPLRYTDPSGHYSEEEIMQAFGVSTWEEVLALFLQGSGTLLENRWGWLEVLRKAQDGDLILPTPWDIDGIRSLYAGAYKIHRDSEGKILVGDVDHAYFANHQARYTLISEHLSMPFNTQYSKIHWHPNYKIFDYSIADAEAIGLDIASILAEATGLATGPWAAIGEPLQIGLDLVGHYGAGQAWGKIMYPKQNAIKSTDDFLAIGSAIPVAGIAVDLADIGAHALGARVVWTP